MGKCPGYYMNIKPDGYKLYGEDWGEPEPGMRLDQCKYVSIKHVGKSLARTEVYKPGGDIDKEESLPILRIEGRCKTAEGEFFTGRRELAYWKHGLIITRLK
jgi:hypothetical protein